MMSFYEKQANKEESVKNSKKKWNNRVGHQEVNNIFCCFPLSDGTSFRLPIRCGYPLIIVVFLSVLSCGGVKVLRVGVSV